MSKQITSCIAIAIFFILAIASKADKLGAASFGYSRNVEEEKGNFLVMNDGSRVNGKEIKWKSGALTKDQIQIDGQKFAIKEVKGYLSDGVFKIRKGNEYIERIVHGKINIYKQFRDVTTTSVDRDGRTHYSHRTTADYYSQIGGDDGNLVGIADQKDIQKLVKDCPIAVEMASLSDKQMRKAIKKNHNYLNDIFDTYNNGCKQKSD